MAVASHGQAVDVDALDVVLFLADARLTGFGAVLLLHLWKEVPLDDVAELVGRNQAAVVLQPLHVAHLAVVTAQLEVRRVLAGPELLHLDGVAVSCCEQVASVGEPHFTH